MRNQRAEALKLGPTYGMEMGGLGLGSYRPRADGRYVIERTPGYFVFAGILHRVKAERLLNILLHFGLILVFYVFGRIYLTRFQTWILLCLIVFSPAVLIMLYRQYMASYANYALMGMAGASYFIAFHYSEKHSERAGKALFWWVLSGILFGMAFFVRVLLLPTIMIFVAHFCFHLFKSRREECFYRHLSFLSIFISGIMIFIVAILVYNSEVNGSPFVMGYSLGKPKQSVYCFSFQRLFYPEPLHPIAIIIRNIIRMPEFLVRAYPIILLAIPGIPLAFRHSNRSMFWIFLLWLASIYLLYIQFLVFHPRHFMVISRLYITGLIPLCYFAVFTLSRLGSAPAKMIVSFIVMFSIAVFLNYLCRIDVDPFNLGILEFLKTDYWQPSSIAWSH